MQQQGKKSIILTIAMAMILCASVARAEIIYSNIEVGDVFDCENCTGAMIYNDPLEGSYQMFAMKFSPNGDYYLSTIELALKYSNYAYENANHSLKISLIKDLVTDTPLPWYSLGTFLESTNLPDDYPEIPSSLATATFSGKTLLENGKTYWVVVEAVITEVGKSSKADWMINKHGDAGYCNYTSYNGVWWYQGYIPTYPDWNQACAFRVSGNPPITNHEPVLSLPDIPPTVVLDNPLTFTATATDPDYGDTLTFSLVNAPQGATIDQDGNFSWTPTVVRTFSFDVMVTDDQASVTKTVTVEVVSALNISVTSVMPRNTKVWTVTVLITNPGATTAYYVTVDTARLDSKDTNSPLPLVYGAIKPGASKQCTLQFKKVPSGPQTLDIQGTCSLGGFFTSQTVTVTMP
ncbi:MAG: hypothetical protein ACE15F_00665 [bacterium]